MLHKNKILEINVNLLENKFWINEIDTKERVTFQLEGINATFPKKQNLVT